MKSGLNRGCNSYGSARPLFVWLSQLRFSFTKSHLPPFHNAFPADSGMSTQYLYDIHNYLHILIYIQKKLAFAFIIVYLCRKIFRTLAIRTACRLGT